MIGGGLVAPRRWGTRIERVLAHRAEDERLHKVLGEGELWHHLIV